MKQAHSKPNVVHITWSNPPVNALSLATRKDIYEAVGAALADDRVDALVLSGEGGRFSGGADVREFNTEDASAFPSIIDIGRLLEESEKPCIAAIEGVALGGGLELALFCHGRVASGQALLGLPEVKLGVMPGAQGTQRLPRLIMAGIALEMMMEGRFITGAEAEQLGLVEAVTEGEPVTRAMQFAAEMVISEESPPRVQDMPVRFNGEPEAELARAMDKARSMRRGPAPEAIVTSVARAAGSRPDEAEAADTAAFFELAATPEAIALQHLFFAERSANRIESVASGATSRTIKLVGVVGAGTMGTGIAMAFANSGFRVHLFDANANSLARSEEIRSKAYASAQRRGKMDNAAAEAAQARIATVTSLDAMADADLIVEAVIEDMAVKKTIFAELDTMVRPDAVLATNTSFLDVAEIASVTETPARVLGMHFFSPAHIMRLVEVIRVRDTSDAALLTAMAVVRKLGKIGVVAGNCDGFIGNRMIDQYFLRANELLMEGASPRQVDDAMRGFGFAMGPFEMSDMAGNDVAWLNRKRHLAEDKSYRFPEIADAAAERGWYGQKTGKGWYIYLEGSRQGLDSPELLDLLDDVRARAGIEPRNIDAEEIVDRCIYALVNEGAKILEEGHAQRASDIDVVYVRGFGFPDLKGGPMHHAERMGLARIVDRINEFASASRFPGWEPAPLLVERAGTTGRLD
ncbi:3-hydroxyacyl-CoA dehydrogenase NAD-binding domain-containing protein [Hoeflea sp. G2-23]|uniref:3-hydroxyacyl-CoA dehydrogenase NAD-binding domain-containing protein n=1 Tax=Hoeflea algicola TaxID=2983763 RepID=A0ABT3ZEG4_9HYPH|nr:3-hydroxyacyl-CoA dehydrogenase NAD-binding domain-containing protein [Hoeflea algicola]MCY0150190.1 3-hydroxyacyl-CoA dehydrogenase NAD-binding domain-containing protein [Hoeflea algicola]